MDDRGSPSASDAGSVAYLLVRARGVTIALPSEHAIEVAEIERCYPVPATPAYVLGITSWRGAPLPLVDLGPALDLGEGPRQAPAGAVGRRAVIVSTASYLVGLVVDATLGVVAAGASETRAPSVVGGGRLPELGVAEIDTPRAGLAVAIDVEAFLDAVRVG